MRPLARSRVLVHVWLASTLFVVAPCSRVDSPNGGATDGTSIHAEATDPEVEWVHERLAALERHIGAAERRAVAEVIVDASRTQQVPTALVLAVIEVESGFDPFAVSHMGALGLMQVLPSTGAPVARQLGIAWRGSQTLFDAEANVRIGVAYLRELIDRYANVRAALAAYNWGPGAIDNRLREGDGLPARYADRVLGAYRLARLADS